MNNFLNFLKKLNITKMVIGLVISGALADLVTILIQELVNPWVPEVMIPKEQKYLIFGKEINVSAIIGKVVGVLASMIFAFVIWKVLKPDVV